MKHLYSVICLSIILVFQSFYSSAQCPMAYPTIGGSCHDLAPYWSVASGADHYEYVLDTSMSNPTGSGTATTATALTFYPLPAGIQYYFHLRSVCSGSAYSWWSTTPATTACDSITAVNISDTYDSSADVNWTTFLHCETHFEYAVNTVATPPTSPAAWTSTTGNSVTVKGLSPNTTYFVFVRDSCGYGFGHTAGNHFQTQPLGLANISSGPAQINVYPNPVKNILVIRNHGNIPVAAQIQILDILGRVLKSVAMSESSLQLNIGDFPPATYFVRYTDAASSQTFQILKN